MENRIQRLLDNEDFIWFLKELKRMAKENGEITDAYQARGEIYHAQYSAGIKRGLELAETYPETVIKSTAPTEIVKDVLRRLHIIKGGKNVTPTE